MKVRTRRGRKKDTQWGRSYCSGAKVRVIIIIINSVTTTT